MLSFGVLARARPSAISIAMVARDNIILFIVFSFKIHIHIHISSLYNHRILPVTFVIASQSFYFFTFNRLFNFTRK